MMTLTLSTRMATAKPSMIMMIDQRAKELKAAGEPVISFGIGVPGFKPPAHVYEAAHKAVDKDTGNYHVGRGDAPVLEAWQAALKRKNLGDWNTANVAVQNGGKGALFNLFLTLLSPGDGVILQAPYWASYPEMVQLAGGEPIILPCPAAQNYKLKPEQLRLALENNAHAKVFLFNNPSNPTGMVYSPGEVAALAGVLVDFPDVWIISDDIYDELLFDGVTTQHLLHARPELRPQMILCNSLSKTYGMPGWRVGLLAAPKAVIDAVLLITSQSHTHVTFVPLAAAAAALSGDQTFLPREVMPVLSRKRDTALKALAALPGVTCPVPQGAFYAFPNLKALFGKHYKGTLIRDGMDFCQTLLEAEKLALVPGVAFGDPEAVRVSYAGDEAELAEGLARLTRFINELK